MEKKKELTPIGYMKIINGRMFAVIFGGWLGFWTLMAFINHMETEVVLVLAGIVAFIFIGGFLSDLTVNRKSAKRIAYRTEMLGCMEVKAEVQAIRVRPYVNGKEKSPELIEVKGYHYKLNQRAYRIEAAFYNPLTGKDETAVSELYYARDILDYEKVKRQLASMQLDSLKPDMRIREDMAYVYCHPDGRVWVEPILKEESLTFF